MHSDTQCGLDTTEVQSDDQQFNVDHTKSQYLSLVIYHTMLIFENDIYYTNQAITLCFR